MMAMKRMSILASHLPPERARTLPQDIKQYKEESEKENPNEMDSVIHHHNANEGDHQHEVGISDPQSGVGSQGLKQVDDISVDSHHTKEDVQAKHSLEEHDKKLQQDASQARKNA